jgi:hypothetical protein
MALRVLKVCDGRKKSLIQDWEAWLTAADNFYLRFLDRIGVSPFYYHEVASVGFLASSAALAGFLPLNEYEIIKKGSSDKRTRGDGRADLWFDSGRRCYSFEAKRAYVAATMKNLSEIMNIAYNDIACIDRSEYHDAAAILIARVRDEHREEIYEKFAESDAVDLAYHIGPNGPDGAYLFFKLVDA